MAKKTYKKKTYKKKRTVKRIKNDTSVYRNVVMGWLQLGLTAAGGGGYTDLAYCFPLNFPLRYVATGSTFGLIPHLPASYDRIFALFNEYRVLKFELIIIPDGMDVKLNTAIADTSDAPSLLYVYKDHEDYHVPSSEGEMLNAGTMPSQFTFKNKLRYSYTNPDKTWMSTRDVSITPVTALSAETDMSGPDTFRSLKAFFPRLQFAPAGGPTYTYGRMYCRWSVEARGVRIHET